MEYKERPDSDLDSEDQERVRLFESKERLEFRPAAQVRLVRTVGLFGGRWSLWGLPLGWR